MPNSRIRDNKVTHPNTILQNEHEDRADAKRVVLTDRLGEFQGTPDNPVNVQITTEREGYPTGYYFNEVTAVLAETPTSVVQFIVPVGFTALPEYIAGSGENIAQFTIYFNDLKFEVKRSRFEALNVDFDFRSNGLGMKMVAGDVLRLEVVHFRPEAANFEGRIQVILREEQV